MEGQPGAIASIKLIGFSSFCVTDNAHSLLIHSPNIYLLSMCQDMW